MPLCSVRLLAPGRKHNLCKLSHFSGTFLFYWSISACIRCTFSINSMNSRCLHSFPFNLSRIKFLGLYLLSYFCSSFPYLFYRLTRPLSKVETRRDGFLPFFDFVSFLLLCLPYFPLPFLFFDFLNVPCFLLFSSCSYFCNIYTRTYHYTLKPALKSIKLKHSPSSCFVNRLVRGFLIM